MGLMDIYLRYIPFYVVDCLVYGNLGRLDAPFKFFQPLDTPEDLAEHVGYASSFVCARFSELGRGYLFVQIFAGLEAC